MGLFSDLTTDELIDRIKAKERKKLSSLPPDELFSYDLNTGWDKFTREELEKMYKKLMEVEGGR